MDKAARRASRKAAWRLIPFLMLCYLVAFLDRVNVGFAALTMNKELGLTAEMCSAHLLDPPDRLSHRLRRRGRHCIDKFDRQSWGLCRPVCHRLD